MARTTLTGDQVRDDSLTGDDIDESTLILNTIKDADGDTKVQVEESADEDKIRFDIAGAEKMVLDGTGLGVGTASPATTFHAYANVSNAYVATIDNDQASAGHVLKLSTDGNGSGSRLLEMEDGDGDIVFRARADGRFGFGPDGVDSMGAGTFVVGIDNSSHTADIAISQRLQHLGDSNTYMDFPSNDNISFTAGGNTQLEISDSAIHVSQYIRHIGDTNTHINFTDDKIILKAGNLSMITMEEKDSAPHEVRINNGGNNIDFVVEDNSGNAVLMTDASTSKVGIGTTGPDRSLDVLSAVSPQLRLTHTDGSKYVDFQATDAGDFAITGSNANATYHFTSTGHTTLAIQSSAGDGDSQVGFSVDGGASLAFSLGVDDGDSDKFKIGTSTIDTNTRLTIDASGNVGIGTTSPSELLQINAAADGDECFIQFQEAGADRAKVGINTSNNLLIHNQFINKHIVFKVNDQGNTREALRIDGAVSEVVVN